MRYIFIRLYSESRILGILIFLGYTVSILANQILLDINENKAVKKDIGVEVDNLEIFQDEELEHSLLLPLGIGGIEVSGYYSSNEEEYERDLNTYNEKKTKVELKKKGISFIYTAAELDYIENGESMTHIIGGVYRKEKEIERYRFSTGGMIGYNYIEYNKSNYIGSISGGAGGMLLGSKTKGEVSIVSNKKTNLTSYISLNMALYNDKRILESGRYGADLSVYNRGYLSVLPTIGSRSSILVYTGEGERVKIFTSGNIGYELGNIEDSGRGVNYRGIKSKWELEDKSVDKENLRGKVTLGMRYISSRGSEFIVSGSLGVEGNIASSGLKLVF